MVNIRRVSVISRPSRVFAKPVALFDQVAAATFIYEASVVVAL